jgi:hypothetical protein
MKGALGSSLRLLFSGKDWPTEMWVRGCVMAWKIRNAVHRTCLFQRKHVQVTNQTKGTNGALKVPEQKSNIVVRFVE